MGGCKAPVGSIVVADELGSSTAWSVVTVLVRPEVHGLRRIEKKADLFTEYRRLLCRLLILKEFVTLIRAVFKPD